MMLKMLMMIMLVVVMMIYNGNNDDDADDSCLNPPGLLPHNLSAVSAPPPLDICSSSQETSPAFQLLWHIVSFAFLIGKEKKSR